MTVKQKNKMIFPKLIASIIILFSLSIILFSFKYKFISFLYPENIENANSLIPLYAKNQYQKTNEFSNKIAIKNGCGKKHLGLIYKRYLLDLGYDITETSNTTHPNGDYHFGHSATKILFHKKNENSAISLANELGVQHSQILEEYKENNFHDLTLILGQNYINLKSYKTAKKFNPFKND